LIALKPSFANRKELIVRPPAIQFRPTKSTIHHPGAQINCFGAQHAFESCEVAELNIANLWGEN
jgi:hypothetical protein